MCLVYFPIYPTHIYIIYTYYLICLIFELRHKMMIPCYCIHLFLPCFAFPWFAPHRANRVTRQAQTREPRQPMSQGCAKTAPWIPPATENDPVVIGTQQWSNDSNDALGCTIGVFFDMFLWFLMDHRLEKLWLRILPLVDIKWIQKAPTCDPNGYWLQHTS